MSKSSLPKFDLVKFAKKRKSYRIVACGTTQSGKTYFLKDLTTKLQQYKKVKIYIVDIKYEFNSIKTLTIPFDLRQNNFKRKVRKIKVNGIEYDDPIKITEFVSAFAWNTHPSLVYIEEAEEFLNVNAHLPRQHPLLYKCLQQGASRNISVIVASQMISKLHKSFVRQSTDIFIFAVKKKNAWTLKKF
ncbi:MAG: genome packaging ATPase [Asgard archaea virus SkuldV2]|nr:MAG: genome packaging ATPase [Asgard archaea virus SkuldV2]